MKPYIIIANVKDIDRRTLERIEASVFESISELPTEITNKTSVIPLHEFMDDVNDARLEDFTNKWIGYIYIKN